jgi:hypothetical protein
MEELINNGSPLMKTTSEMLKFSKNFKKIKKLGSEQRYNSTLLTQKFLPLLSNFGSIFNKFVSLKMLENWKSPTGLPKSKTVHPPQTQPAVTFRLVPSE